MTSRQAGEVAVPADMSPTAHLISRLAEPVEATREALDEASARAASFEADELAQAQTSRRVFLWGCIGLGGLLGASQVSNFRLSNRIAELSEKPRIETVVVAQDTGTPYRLSEQVQPPADIEDKYVKQMAGLYVGWREEYYRPLDLKHFNTLTWLSTADEQYRLKQWWEKGEAPAQGPRIELANGGEAHIQILNDARPEASAAGERKDHIILRIKRTLVRPNSPVDEKYWRITLFYDWDKTFVRSDVEFVNPYGFVVTRYLRDRIFV